jgi:mono/diheme cytochrome c family protein
VKNFALLFLLVAVSATAGNYNPDRARYHYQLYCQGCHTPDGSGGEGVPKMREHIGYFLNTPVGREYLVRVPGSATSVLDNEQLAEVLNWIVITFGGGSVHQPFSPYLADEVGELRKNPLNELERYRAQLLEEIGDRQTGSKE